MQRLYMQLTAYENWLVRFAQLVEQPNIQRLGVRVPRLTI